MDVQPLLPSVPFHLSTLGLFDGQLGKSTLGYIIAPDIVPRFPDEALVEGEALVAFVQEGGLFGELRLEGSPAAFLDEGEDLLALFKPNGSLTAEVDGEIIGYEAVTVDEDKLAATVDEDDLDAEVADDDVLEAEVEDGGLTAEVEVEAETGLVEQRPGEGRCR